MKQLDIDFTGEQLRDIGIDKAIDHACTVYENWNVIAYSFLIDYIELNESFMTEDVRIKSIGIVPLPPSNRAWGGIIVKAVKSGLIKRIGFANVKNPTAHATPATVWERVIKIT